MAEIPRNEYPRPQFARPDWLCLNGRWQFEIDHGDSGLERGLLERDLADEIVVPFCPEAKLSGIGHEDFMAAVWYRRFVTIPDAFAGRRLLLHFQAVDYDATVWVNGVEVARHRGGFTPWTADITEAVGDTGKATIIVRARDDGRAIKPMGKQSQRYPRHGCHYTRTTGIWQTVWLEPVPLRAHFDRPRITPDVGGGSFIVQTPIRGDRVDLTVRATLSDADGQVASARTPAAADFAPCVELGVPEDRRQLWSPEDPHLYDLRLELLDGGGSVVDALDSYAGLRGVTLDGPAIRINGQTIFQRLVLDQGYYPDGIMTAPSDQALREDIEIAQRAGFNGARLHQKVFEERFLHWADRMGYLVWGEFADWGCNTGPTTEDNQQPTATCITQWLEAVGRDFSHPCIVGWCPLNETRQLLHDRITPLDDVTRGMFLATKTADPTRPVLDASGYAHRVAESDVYDSHQYQQNPARFAETVGGLADGKPFVNEENGRAMSIAWRGQPYFVSEFGGIWWNPHVRQGEASWGYGDRPKSAEEFYDRFEKLCAVLLDDPNMFGYCYTQLTDVFQEQNGVVKFDRTEKLDLSRLYAAQRRPAAIERRDEA